MSTATLDAKRRGSAEEQSRPATTLPTNETEQFNLASFLSFDSTPATDSQSPASNPASNDGPSPSSYSDYISSSDKASLAAESDSGSSSRGGKSSAAPDMSVPWAQFGQGPFTVDSGGGPGQPQFLNPYAKPQAMNSGSQPAGQAWPYIPQQSFSYANNAPNMLDPRLLAMSNSLQNGPLPLLPLLPQQMWPMYSGLQTGLHPLLQQSFSGQSGANFPSVAAPPLQPFLQPNMLPFLQQQGMSQPPAPMSSLSPMQSYQATSEVISDQAKQSTSSTSSQKGRRTKTGSASQVSFAPLPDTSFNPMASTSSSRNAQSHASANPTDLYSSSQNNSPKQKKHSRRSSVQANIDPATSWSQQYSNTSTSAPFDAYRSPAQSAPVSRLNSQDHRTDFYSQRSAPMSRQSSQEQQQDFDSRLPPAQSVSTGDAEFVAQMWELYGGPAPIPEGVTMENLTWRLREVQLSQAMNGGNGNAADFQQFQQSMPLASSSELPPTLQPSRVQEAKEVEQELETRGRKTTVRTAGNTPEDSSGTASTPHSQKE